MPRRCLPNMGMITTEASHTIRLYHGAAWYPEQWDGKTLLEDVLKMRELGLNIVRLGEFAWSTMEPRDGVFEFDWLRRALDLAAEHGLSALLGTPSAAPPQWLLLRHPEIGYVDPDGYRHKHGGRQHACYNNETFRLHANRIAVAMAEAVGNHKSVVGWQIDNEVRGHQKLCLCEACRVQWSKWLSKRYTSLDELNTRWGTEVWSNTYESFSDVPRPYPVPCWSHHYSVLVNYRRFMSDSAVDFLNEQVGLIRKVSSAPITHNSEDSVDEWRLFAGLDFASADIYVNHLGPSGAQWRIDSMRNVKPGRRYWTAETGFEGLHEGRILDDKWLACFAFQNFTGGSQAFLYWPWRQLRTGTEISHGAVLYSHGKPTPGGEAARNVSAMLSKLEPILAEYSPGSAEVALIRSEFNGHYFYSDQIGGLEAGFSYEKHMAAQYQSLARTGTWRDVIFDDAPLGDRRIVFSPYLPHVTPGFLEKMRLHLERGGAWVVGPYCGYREVDHTVPHTGLYGLVEEYFGFETRAFCPGGPVRLTLINGTDTTAEMVLSAFQPSGSDEVLGTYGEGRFAGQAWGIAREAGRGRIYMLGSELADQGRQSLFEYILDREKIPRFPVPARVWLSPQISRDGSEAWAISNWDESAHAIPLPWPGRDLLTGQLHGPEIRLDPFTSAFIAFA